MLASCSRSAIRDRVDATPLERPVPQPELCNQLDDDLDSQVDELFVDDEGRYVDQEHCGSCNVRCEANRENELAVECGILFDVPVCIAIECADGFAVSETGRCIPRFDRLCLPCQNDDDCGGVEGSACVTLGSESRCVAPCDRGECPAGYSCRASDADNGIDVCEPVSGSCSCEPGDNFDLACAIPIEGEDEDEEESLCVGAAVCSGGVLSECVAFEEVCDEVDNNCDGTVDEGFRDQRGAYILDIRNCGECGVDCTQSMVPEGDLICGGDPFAPSCVLSCPDALDGIQPGDRIDGDRKIATGCECTVQQLIDVPGPVLAEGENLDVNCDGADGIVLESFYVAPDGDDTGPGSPSRPLKTISVAMTRAAESLGEAEPRPHVFIASGAYSEVVEVPDGIKIHGGYRRDFLALDPDGFRVEIRSSATSTNPLSATGVAMIIRNAGSIETVVEWVSVIGRDAVEDSQASFGLLVDSPGPRLSIRDSIIRSGSGGRGTNGTSGQAGKDPDTEAGVGDNPRGAQEDASRQCIFGSDNTVRGGSGGTNQCGGTNARGGDGGSATCPEFAQFQNRGQDAAGGARGGDGGQDSQGPIMGLSCSRPVCCGLADFSVPTDFRGPQSGSQGTDGTSGLAGRGCQNPFGSFDDALMWQPDSASAGTNGGVGSGGGGGGAGGGAAMDWFDGVCEFADGLGGGGGGGGAGGCGGAAGEAGTSGGPSVAMVVRNPGGTQPWFEIRNVELSPADGGRGGNGGAGGDGGRGGEGALGGELARRERTTPTLSGPFGGGRGGRGGVGGAGGGGGGGCGGGSVGVWILGSRGDNTTDGWRSNNTFQLGRGGRAGQGGGGFSAAADGEEGGSVDVLVR